MASMSEGRRGVRVRPKGAPEKRRRARRGAAHWEDLPVVALLSSMRELLATAASPGARSLPPGLEELSTELLRAREAILLMYFSSTCQGESLHCE